MERALESQTAIAKIVHDSSREKVAENLSLVAMYLSNENAGINGKAAFSHLWPNRANGLLRYNLRQENVVIEPIDAPEARIEAEQ